jgi:hypothetical protein
MTTTDFKPIPAAALDRMHAHLIALGSAVSVDDQLRALFLLHCECKAALPDAPGSPAPVELDEVVPPASA